MFYQPEARVFELIDGVTATTADEALLESCLVELQQMVLKVFQNWQVRSFGSTANGFNTRFSDLDVSVYPDDSSGEDSKASLQIAQKTFLPVLHESPRFDVVEEIWAARIPVVRLRFDKCLDVDITFCNTEPFPNTKLLKLYSKLDAKVRLFVILVKLWAKGEHLVGAKGGHLSSYSFNLMTLYFLQVDEYIQMPCLPTRTVDGEIQAPDVKWSCPLSLYEMMIRFFSFYASKYQWGQEVVSIRLGQRLGIENDVYKALGGRYSSNYIHIEDPIIPDRNLNCVLQQDQENMLYAKICEAANIAQAGAIPPGLPAACQAYSRKVAPLDAWVHAPSAPLSPTGNGNVSNGKSPVPPTLTSRNTKTPHAAPIISPTGNKKADQQELVKSKVVANAMQSKKMASPSPQHPAREPTSALSQRVHKSIQGPSPNDVPVPHGLFRQGSKLAPAPSEPGNVWMTESL